jgi:hypothetical protein
MMIKSVGQATYGQWTLHNWTPETLILRVLLGSEIWSFFSLMSQILDFFLGVGFVIAATCISV